MAYEHEEVYIYKLNSGYWITRDRKNEMQVGIIQDTEDDAIRVAVSNGYIVV